MTITCLITVLLGLFHGQNSLTIPLWANQEHLESAQQWSEEADSMALLGQFDRAAPLLQRALGVFEAQQRWGDYIKALNDISFYFRERSMYDSAGYYAFLSLSIAQRRHLDPSAELIGSYLSVGAYHDVTAQFDSALYYYDLALQMAVPFHGNESDETATIYHNIGGIYMSISRYDEAMDFCRKGLTIRQGLHGEEHSATADSYHSIGSIYIDLDRYEEALDNYEKALSIRLQLFEESHPVIADTYYALGLTYDYMLDYNLALTYYRRAEELYLGAFGEEHTSLIKCYDLIAGVYSNLKRRKKALFYYEKALQLGHRVLKENHPVLANLYFNIGVEYGNRGDESVALDYFMKEVAITLNNYGEVHRDVIYSYKALGTLLRDRGNKDTALHYYKKALNIALTIFGESSVHVADMYTHLGDYWDIAEELGLAKRYYEKSLRTYKSLSDDDVHVEIADQYNSIGFVELKLKNYHSARDYALNALAIQKDRFGPHGSYVTYSYNQLGDIELARQNFEGAKQYYQKALASNRSSWLVMQDTLGTGTGHKYHDVDYGVASLTGKAMALEGQYKVERDLKQLLRAYDLLMEADQLISERRRNMLRDEDKIYTSRTFSGFYNQAIDVCYQLHIALKDETYQNDAFRLIEKTKATALGDILADQTALEQGFLPPHLIELQDSVRAGISYLQSQIKASEAEFHGSLQSPAIDLKPLSGTLFSLLRTQDSLVSHFEMEYPKYHQLKYRPYIVGVNGVQRELSEQDAIIEYFIGNQAVYVIGVTKEACSFKRLPRTSNFERVILDLRAALSNSPGQLNQNPTDPEIRSLADQVYQNYVAPGVRELPEGIRNLTIVADGILGYLPFEVLVSSNQFEKEISGSYSNVLYNGYTISYAPSVAIKYGKFRPKHEASEKLIAFAPGENPQGAPSFVHLRGNLKPLIWNKQEVNDIARVIGGVALTGASARERAFKESVSDYKVLHIAAHAVTDDTNPMNSGFILESADDLMEDGYLYAHEIYNMNIGADLAVLSACQTGYGRLAQGEGIMSLARAFSAAGCQSLVVTHWPVDDRVTAEIMLLFYQNLNKGWRKDQALHMAKLEFLQTAPPFYQHPFFWSSFVLVGDTDPIDFNAGVEWIRVFYLWVGVAGLGIMVWLVLYRKQ